MMINFLKLLSGICWSIVYIESIRKGFKEKTYAMPIFALALNISWEGIYALNSFLGVVTLQSWINLIWFLLDCVILYTYFKFGKSEISKYTTERYFVLGSIFIIFMAFVLQYSFIFEFNEMSGIYSAFIQNLLMSVLYINMLVSRNSIKGQSKLIAYSKWIGTLAPTILFGLIYNYQLAFVLGIFCSIFDIIYIIYLSNYKKIVK